MSPQPERRTRQERPLRARTVVRELRRRGSLTFPQLQATLGFPSKPLQDTIDQLQHAGLVEEEDEHERLALSPDIGILAGVEVTGRYARAAVTRFDFSQPVISGRIRLEIGNPEESLREIARLLGDLLHRGAHQDRVKDRLVGVGLTLPGPILREPNPEPSGKDAAIWDRHPETGTIMPGWDRAARIGARFAELLQQEQGICPPRQQERRFVWLENDASAGALGVLSRWRENAPEYPEDLIYVRVTHGIGAGIINKGHLLTGSHGFAGELGHVAATAQGGLCHVCGKRGCLETLAADRAVVAQLRPVLHAAGYQLQHKNQVIGPDKISDLESLLRTEQLHAEPEHRRAHPVIDRALTESGVHVGLALAQMCTFLDPQAVVLEGVQARYQSPQQPERRPFVDAVKQTIHVHALPHVSSPERLQITTWEDLPGDTQLGPELLGALALVIDHLGDAYLLKPIEQWIIDGTTPTVDFG